MKDYTFMTSDNRLHKTRFCKKKGGGLTKTFLIRRGLEQKGGDCTILHFEGLGGSQKEGVRGLLICPFESGKCGKKGRKLQKFECLENEKSFLDKIKNIFHSF